MSQSPDNDIINEVVRLAGQEVEMVTAIKKTMNFLRTRRVPPRYWIIYLPYVYEAFRLEPPDGLEVFIDMLLNVSYPQVNPAESMRFLTFFRTRVTSGRFTASVRQRVESFFTPEMMRDGDIQMLIEFTCDAVAELFRRHEPLIRLLAKQHTAPLAFRRDGDRQKLLDAYTEYSGDAESARARLELVEARYDAYRGNIDWQQFAEDVEKHIVQF